MWFGPRFQAKGIAAVPAPVLGSHALSLPQIPGFDVTIASSSDEKLLAKDGTWTASDEAKDVTVKLAITSKADPSDTATTEDVKVSLPARADSSALQSTLKFTNDLSKEDLVSIQQVVDEANAVLADTNASELQIAVANLKLVEAIHGLDTSLPDREMLRQLADASKAVYDALDAEYADGEHKDSFKAAYDTAASVLDDVMSSSESIQSAYFALKDAAAAIVDDKLDSSELKTTVDAYASVADDLSAYTEKSGKAFADEFAKARDTLKHPGSQDAIEARVKALKEAFDGLVRRVDAEAVNAAVKHVESFLGGKYTSESLATLKQAIVRAKDVAADASASYDDGVAAVQELYATVGTLVPAGSGSASNDSANGGNDSKPGQSSSGGAAAGKDGATGASKTQKGKLAQTGDTTLVAALAPAVAGAPSALAGALAVFKHRRDDGR